MKLGSPVAHGHSGSLYGRAQKVFDAECLKIGRHPSIVAWVIRCAATKQERRALALTLRATHCFVLIPPITVAASRARLRDADCGATIAAISGWFGRYEPDGFSRVIRSG